MSHITSRSGILIIQFYFNFYIMVVACEEVTDDTSFQLGIEL